MQEWPRNGVFAGCHSFVRDLHLTQLPETGSQTAYAPKLDGSNCSHRLSLPKIPFVLHAVIVGLVLQRATRPPREHLRVIRGMQRIVAEVGRLGKADGLRLLVVLGHLADKLVQKCSRLPHLRKKQ